MNGKIKYEQELIVVFDGKPDANTRKTLKDAGFWWSKEKKHWYLAKPKVMDENNALIDGFKYALDAAEMIATYETTREQVEKAADAEAHRQGALGMLIEQGIC